VGHRRPEAGAAVANPIVYRAPPPGYSRRAVSTIHPTAIVDTGVELGAGVEIGPFCVLRGRVHIGDGTRLIGNVWLQGPAEIGRENRIYPFVSIGFAPQASGYDPATAGHGVVIGDRNVLRENVTVHRAMTEDGPTRIGNDNFFMVGSHAGHDAQVGDHCTLANAALLGGHVRLEDRVTVGGGAAVHQHCRIGRGAMLSGAVAAAHDVPPYFLLTGISVCGSVNLVGMRRMGLDNDEIADVKWAWRVICREGNTRPVMLEKLRARAERPLIAAYVAFVEGTRRGLCRGVADPRRKL
jgi:UDP-N-acetylglucosamine acyltransferase